MSSKGEQAPGLPGRPMEQLKALARRSLEAAGLELVHLVHRREGRRWVLRLYVERPGGGVTLEDCVRASRQFATALEVADLIQHTYTLEVSSPGLDRPLFEEEDYRRFAGRRVRLTTHRPLAGRRHFLGTLLGCVEGRVGLRLEDGREQRIPFDAVAAGRLEADLKGKV